MPAKPSGMVKTRTVRVRQKNGDTYVFERQTIYDPDKKYNRILKSHLLSKIPKDTQTPVPTRPKQMKRANSEENKGNIAANRVHIGMMDIIAHIGAESGIDDALYQTTDTGTAQKIISLARYLLATNGQSLPGILTWQLNHPIPYTEGLTEDIYHNLFVRIGHDESIQQNFFAHRAKGLGSRAAIAYDTTTVSTYSENQIEARYGFNKDGDGLKTIKVLTLYSIDTRRPIAFTKQPGNLPDVITIKNSLKQLSALGLDAAEIVTDNGFYSEQNISEMFQAEFGFITLVKTSLSWVRKEIDTKMEELSSVHTICDFDPNIHAVTVSLTRTFAKERKYASQKSGKKKGDIENFSRKVYLHIFYSLERHNAARASFDADIIELKSLLEKGFSVDELAEDAQKKVEKYLDIKTRGSKVTVTAKDELCREAYRYQGYFTLVSNREKDAVECLRKYRKRETIEDFFEEGKQYADGKRPRVWDTDTLRGRMFVQFVALCYYEYFSDKVRQMKQSLSCSPEDAEKMTKAELNANHKLLTWIKNTPLYIQLQWFDAVENVTISDTLKTKRWNTETTLRDRNYLARLGL